MRIATVNGYNLIRSIKEFDASSGEYKVVFDILATSTSKEFVVKAMEQEVKTIEDYPAIRECIVTKINPEQYSVVTNDFPDNLMREVITDFAIIEMPIEVELRSSAANDIMWANEEACREEDIESAMYEAFPDWDEDISEEEMEAIEEYKKNATARYEKNISNDNRWRVLMEDAMKAEFDNPKYAAASRILQEIADNM